MNFWQIVLLIFLGALIGFVLSAKLASRYYIGVGMAIILHSYGQASSHLEMDDQMEIIADEVSTILSNKYRFDMILRSARETVKGAMFE